MRVSTMQLRRCEAIELVLFIRASLLSQVATRLSIYFRCVSPALEVKTTELEKSYKIKLWGSGLVTPWSEELWQEECEDGEMR